MKRILLLTGALLFAGSMASAAITAEGLVQEFSAQGFSRIEIKTGLTQIKAEAINGTTKVEVIYDIATGAILKSETSTVGLFDNTTPGVELSDRNRDFLDVGDSDGGSDGDDSGDDDESGDDSGDDDGDDSDDDNGGDDDGDDSDDGNDDSHGGDDSDSDDHGSDD